MQNNHNKELIEKVAQILIERSYKPLIVTDVCDMAEAGEEADEIIELVQQSKWISVDDEQPPKDGTRIIVHKPRYVRKDKRDGYDYTAVIFYKEVDDIRPDYIGNPEDCEESDLITTRKPVTAWSHHYIAEDFKYWMHQPTPPKGTA